MDNKNDVYNHVYIGMSQKFQIYTFLIHVCNAFWSKILGLDRV